PTARPTLKIAHHRIDALVQPEVAPAVPLSDAGQPSLCSPKVGAEAELPPDHLEQVRPAFAAGCDAAISCVIFLAECVAVAVEPPNAGRQGSREAVVSASRHH